MTEPKQKATLRAYLALLTGCTRYTGKQIKKVPIEEAEYIATTLLSLGCINTQGGPNPKVYGVVKYKREALMLLHKHDAYVFQLR